MSPLHPTSRADYEARLVLLYRMLLDCVTTNAALSIRLQIEETRAGHQRRFGPVDDASIRKALDVKTLPL